MSKPTRFDKSTSRMPPLNPRKKIDVSKLVAEQEKLESEQGKALFRAHGSKPFPVVDVPIDL